MFTNLKRIGVSTLLVAGISGGVALTPAHAAASLVLGCGGPSSPPHTIACQMRWTGETGTRTYTDHWLNTSNNMLNNGWNIEVSPMSSGEFDFQHTFATVGVRWQIWVTDDVGDTSNTVTATVP